MASPASPRLGRDPPPEPQRLLVATDANEHAASYSDYDPIGYPKKITDPLDWTTESPVVVPHVPLVR